MKKQKVCKICKKKFTPQRDLQPTCNKMECMLEYSNKHLNKKKRETLKAQRKEVKEFNNNDKSLLKQKAQKLVNEYVRLRDKDLGCISCGTKTGKFDAGHYMSAGGHQQLRYNTINIRKQCFRCNRMLSANLKNYRINLIALIGLDRVERLESDKSLRNYNIGYLKKLIKVFRKKIVQIKKR